MKASALIAKLHGLCAPTAVCESKLRKAVPPRGAASGCNRQTRREEPEIAVGIPLWGGGGMVLMDNRKEASCVTVAGDPCTAERPCVRIPQCLLRGEFAALMVLITDH